MVLLLPPAVARNLLRGMSKLTTRPTLGMCRLRRLATCAGARTLRRCAVGFAGGRGRALLGDAARGCSRQEGHRGGLGCGQDCSSSRCTARKVDDTDCATVTTGRAAFVRPARKFTIQVYGAVATLHLYFRRVCRSTCSASESRHYRDIMPAARMGALCAEARLRVLQACPLLLRMHQVLLGQRRRRAVWAERASMLQCVCRLLPIACACVLGDMCVAAVGSSSAGRATMFVRVSHARGH